MSTVLRLSACLLMAASLVACNKSQPAASADAAETSAAAPQPETATPVAADEATLTLTMDKVKAYVQTLKNVAAAVEADPGIGDPAINISEEDTAQYEARIAASPKLRAVVESAGLSTREFAQMGEVLLGAMMAHGAMEAGQLKTLPEGIDPATVEFVKQHKAEIEALMNEVG